MRRSTRWIAASSCFWIFACAEEVEAPRTETRVVRETAPQFDRQSAIEPRVAEAADRAITRVLGRFPPARGESLAPLDRARTFLTSHAEALGLPAAFDGELIVSRTSDDVYGSSVVHQQLHRGVPVFGGEVLVGLDATGDIIHVENNFVRGLDVVPVASLSEEEAIFSAEVELGAELDRALAEPLLMIAELDGRWTLVWRVFAGVREPRGSWALFIDAQDGRMLRRLDLLREAGPPCVPCAAGSPQCGLLLMQSPIEALNDVALRDTSNVDAAQRWCALSHLTSLNVLTGTYANTTRTPWRVQAPFSSLRSVDQSAVNEVTTYFHVTRSKAYVDQLGFTGVMSFSLPINAYDVLIQGKNAYYDPLAKFISFGVNGTDSAQDVDLIYHEVGHAIQDNQVPGWGATHEGGAMGEGFGDYWAGTLNDDVVVPQLGPACVGPWFAVDIHPYDGTPGSGCLRPLDHPRIYPRDLAGQVHADGVMWSASLWRLRNAVGASVADRLVLKSHTLLTTMADMMAGADAVISADEAIYAGAHRAQIDLAFAGSRIPRTGRATSPLFMSQSIAYSCGSPVDGSGVPYSTAGAYIECRITVPGAERVRFHYAFGSTVPGDGVRISDGLYREVSRSSGPLGTHSAAVRGDTIIARMRSAWTVSGAGFLIDRVEYAVPRACTVDADCNDGDVCNGVEACENGFCRVGEMLDCDDHSVCTTDACHPVTGCSNVAIADGTACNNNLLCDGFEVCVGGVCLSGQPIPCDDLNECNGVEYCAEQAPFCFASRPMVCNDGNPCTIDQCVPGAGCVASVAPNGTACGSTDVCTGVQTCSNGVCTLGAPLDCDDHDLCTGEFCMGDGCYRFPVGEWCNDGDPCNGVESCHPLVGCLSGIGPNCDDGDMCNGVESCTPWVGCTPGQPMVCDDGLMCNGTAHCQPGIGCMMDTPPIHCDNWDPCDGVATCTEGGCVPGTPLLCMDDVCGFDLCVPGYGCAYNVTIENCGICGDRFCALEENPGNCPLDCGVVGDVGGYCGDSWCSAAENASCPVDCWGVVGGGHCGDLVCDAGEDCWSCPLDCGGCPAVCGNWSCEAGEDCWNCPNDCGSCQYCGNWSCEAGEDCWNCPSDCGSCQYCGNGSCDLYEDCWSCPGDCGGCPAICGNWGCEAGEDCSNCPGDCGSCCGNLICGDGEYEDCGTCVVDCGYCAYCGDGWCAPSENCAGCPMDCGACASCGDDDCTPGEDPWH